VGYHGISHRLRGLQNRPSHTSSNLPSNISSRRNTAVCDSQFSRGLPALWARKFSGGYLLRKLC
jgi:hypothetical protein